MGGLLPRRTDAAPAADPNANIVSISEQASDDVFEALASETTREVLETLYDEPGTASDLASRVDTSVQNVQYHLNKLEETGLVAVVDTWYSNQGKEMKVYAPSNESLVVFAGTKRTTPTLREALSRLLGVIGVIAIGSLLIEHLITLPPGTTFDSHQPQFEPVVVPSPLVTPGTIFLAGGIIVLFVAIILFKDYF